MCHPLTSEAPNEEHFVPREEEKKEKRKKGNTLEPRYVSSFHSWRHKDLYDPFPSLLQRRAISSINPGLIYSFGHIKAGDQLV